MRNERNRQQGRWEKDERDKRAVPSGRKPRSMLVNARDERRDGGKVRAQAHSDRDEAHQRAASLLDAMKSGASADEQKSGQQAHRDSLERATSGRARKTLGERVRFRPHPRVASGLLEQQVKLAVGVRLAPRALREGLRNEHARLDADFTRRERHDVSRERIDRPDVALRVRIPTNALEAYERRKPPFGACAQPARADSGTRRKAIGWVGGDRGVVVEQSAGEVEIAILLLSHRKEPFRAFRESPL
jgi:hypothetical protein